VQLDPKLIIPLPAFEDRLAVAKKINSGTRLTIVIPKNAIKIPKHING